MIYLNDRFRRVITLSEGVHRVIPAVCRITGVTVDSIMSDSRKPIVIRSRLMIAAYCRHVLRLSYPEIAAAIRRKHHSTAHDAVERFDMLPGQEQAEILQSVHSVIHGSSPEPDGPISDQRVVELMEITMNGEVRNALQELLELRKRSLA